MVHWTGENSSVSDLRALAAAPARDPAGHSGGTATAPTRDHPAVIRGVRGDLGTWVTSAAPLLASGHRLLGERSSDSCACLTTGDIPTDFGILGYLGDSLLASRSWVTEEVPRDFGRLQVIEGHPSSVSAPAPPGLHRLSVTFWDFGLRDPPLPGLPRTPRWRLRRLRDFPQSA
ncbi:hypothetical protein P7K49_006056 [Saguinus oedipus]|uniref:Uncharacterized protein n=1 Tax=Saguinus oedipus TaxID=9490 RepID=A0ABQ9W1A7_SAGOE|nr:hypothetical protein P7K49_006056 [Saguinus oedipus]